MLPRAILLDLDDTILDDTGGAEAILVEVCSEGAGKLALDADELVDAVVRMRSTYWSDPERNRRGRLDLPAADRAIVALALAELGIEAPELAASMGNRYRELRIEALTLLPGAVETLEALLGEGVQLGLVTNGAADAQRAKVERFALDAYFDYVGIEGERGFGKPESAAFETALHRLGVTAAESWMVGDNIEHDIRAAQRLGLHGVWVDKRGSGPPADGAPPDRVVRAISELVE